jgi:hypothetical protein
MELTVQQKVDLWRQKVINGTITDEELHDAIKTLRADREAAAIRGAEKRAAKGPVKTADEMLDELENL